MDLSELFNYYGTDKDRNGYAPIYHTLFDKIKDQSLTILEIGIGTMVKSVHSSMFNYSLEGYKPGGSLRAWRDYFSKSKIIGVDIQPYTMFDEERIKTYMCDSTKQDEVEEVMNQLNCLLDIVIDDGSHDATDQLATLNNFYKYVKEGGFYIIEDIYVGSQITADPEFLNYFVNNNPYFFVGIKNNICVIYKKFINTKRKGY